MQKFYFLVGFVKLVCFNTSKKLLIAVKNGKIKR